MTVVKTLTKEQLTRFGELFGPPPVLTTESNEHYEAIWNLLLECLAPQNFLEMMLIKQVQAKPGNRCGSIDTKVSRSNVGSPKP